MLVNPFCVREDSVWIRDMIRWLCCLFNTWCQYVSKDEKLEKEFPVHSLGGRGHGLMSHDPDIPWGIPTPGGCLSTRRRRVPCGRSSECTGHYPSVRDLPSFSPQWPQASEPAGPETCCPLRLGSSSESATRHCMLARICLSYTLSSSNMCFNKTLLNLFPKGAALTRTKCKQPYCYLKLSCGTILILSLSVLSF